MDRRSPVDTGDWDFRSVSKSLPYGRGSEELYVFLSGDLHSRLHTNAPLELLDSEPEADASGEQVIFSLAKGARTWCKASSLYVK